MSAPSSSPTDDHRRDRRPPARPRPTPPTRTPTTNTSARGAPARPPPRLRARAGAVVAMMVGASAPSPFYPVLQARDRLLGRHDDHHLRRVRPHPAGDPARDRLAVRPRRPPPGARRGLRRPRAEHGRLLARRRRGLLMASRAVQGVAAGLLMSTMSRGRRRPRAGTVPASPRRSTASRPLFGLAAGALARRRHSSTPARTPCRRVRDPHRPSTSRSPGVLALPETSPRHDGVAALAAATGRHTRGRPTRLPPQRTRALRRLGHRWPLPLPGGADRRPAARRPQPPRAGRRRHRSSPGSAPSAPTSAGAVRHARSPSTARPCSPSAPC